MPESFNPKKVSNNDLRNSQFGGGFINADTVNAGRIGGDIWNFFFGQQLAPVGNPSRPENQRVLLAQVKHEVAARLDQSLHNAVLINLSKELQPQQVKRPWDAEIKIGLKPPEPLPENTSIVDVYSEGCIPWNYARFLDYCTERMLLQRVGGRYRFIHKLLQDHFAQMPLK